MADYHSELDPFIHGDEDQQHQGSPDEDLRHWPLIPDALLQRLHDRFPEPRHTPSTSHAECMYAAGQRNVVQFLQQMREEQIDYERKTP